MGWFMPSKREKRKQKRGVQHAQSEQKVPDERSNICRHAEQHNKKRAHTQWIDQNVFLFSPFYSSEKLFYFLFPKKSIQLQKQSKLVRLNFVYGLLFLLSIHNRRNPHACAVLCVCVCACIKTKYSDTVSIRIIARYIWWRQKKNFRKESRYCAREWKINTYNVQSIHQIKFHIYQTNEHNEGCICARWRAKNQKKEMYVGHGDLIRI